MKKLILTCLSSMLVSQVAFAQPQAMSSSNDVVWELQSSWKLDAKPLDLVHTLDRKKVYILGDDQKVHVYSAQGNKLGFIPVDKGVSSIDIAPQGEALYLIDEQKNTFSSMLISLVKNIDITGSPFKGNANAPVTMAIFSDFQ